MVGGGVVGLGFGFGFPLYILPASLGCPFNSTFFILMRLFIIEFIFTLFIAKLFSGNVGIRFRAAIYANY